MRMQEFELENGSLFIDAGLNRHGEKEMTIYSDDSGREEISYEEACGMNAEFAAFYERVLCAPEW